MMKWMQATMSVVVISLVLAMFYSGCGVTDGTGAGSCEWETAFRTVDDFLYVEGKESTPVGISVGASGIFVVGNAKNADSKNNWIVRQSTDQGTTWKTADQYQMVDGQPAGATGVVQVVSTSGENHVYVVGNAYDANTESHWVVRRSTDAGETWQNVDDWIWHAGQPSSAQVITESNGVIYVAGNTHDDDGTPNRHISVRRSTDDGATWSTVESFELDANKSAYVYGIAASGDSVYVAGVGDTDGAQTYRGFVRRSVDGGTTWSLADQFQVAAGKSSYAIQPGFQGSTVFVAGWGSDDDGTANDHAIVRKSTDGGTTWTQVRDWERVSQKGANYRGLWSGDGAVVVIGRSKDDDGTSNDHWTVHRSTDSGTTWETADDFEYVPDKMSYAMAVDVGHSIFAVTGQATDPVGAHSRWITRLKVCK